MVVEDVDLVLVGEADHGEEERADGFHVEAAVEAELDGVRVNRASVRELDPVADREDDLLLVLAPLRRRGNLAAEHIRLGEPGAVVRPVELERDRDRVEVGEDVAGHLVGARGVRVEVLHVAEVRDDQRGVGCTVVADPRRSRARERVAGERAARGKRTSADGALDEDVAASERTLPHGGSPGIAHLLIPPLH